MTSPGSPVLSLADVVVWGSFFLGFGVVLARARNLKKLKWVELRKRMGPANWNFSESWASTFTLVGGILGTILAQSGAIPEPTAFLSNAAYGMLNVLFVAVTVLAPVFYTALQTAEKGGGTGSKAPEHTGFVGSFLLASALTLWGVLGEICTMGLLIGEIAIAGALAIYTSVLWLILVLIAAGLLIWYLWKGIEWRLRDQTIPTALGLAERALPWSVF